LPQVDFDAIQFLPLGLQLVVLEFRIALQGDLPPLVAEVAEFLLQHLQVFPHLVAAGDPAAEFQLPSQQGFVVEALVGWLQNGVQRLRVSLAVAQAGMVRVPRDALGVLRRLQVRQQGVTLERQPGQRRSQLAFAPLQLAEFAVVVPLLRAKFPITESVAQPIQVLADRRQRGLQRRPQLAALAATGFRRGRQVGNGSLQPVEAVFQPPQMAARIGLGPGVQVRAEAGPIAKLAAAVFQVPQHEPPTFQLCVDLPQRVATLGFQLKLALLGVAQSRFATVFVRLASFDLGRHRVQFGLQALQLLFQVGDILVQLPESPFPGRPAVLKRHLQRLDLLLQAAAAPDQFVESDVGRGDFRQSLAFALQPVL